MPDKRLGKVGQCATLFAGTCVGSFFFLLLTALFLGKPIRDTVLSAHGVLTASHPVKLTFEQNAMILDLLQKGALISSSDLLSNISSFYSAMIQILIATFFVFGALSFFAVQSHARRQVEEVAEPLIENAVRHHFGSMIFGKHVREEVDSALQIEMESYDEQIEQIEKMSERIQELESRLREISEAARPEQQEEDE